MTAHHGVVVAVLTYRRPDDLAEALPMLVAAIEPAGAELLVVDNDGAPTAAAVVAPWTAAHRVRYVHEPRPGIAAARNRALEEAVGAEALVFIDDDERPAPGWLTALVDAWRGSGATGAVGPVVSRLPEPLDPWIRAGGWFDRLRHRTGTRVPLVATNNLLLDMARVTELGVRFDEAFGLTGGSDTVFALEVRRRGGNFVWCDEAVVEDVVPAERATRRWVVRRAFRAGNSHARAALHVAPTAAARTSLRARFLARGAARVLGGSGRLLVGTLGGDEARSSRGFRTVVRGAGMVAGAVGYVFAEYRRPRSASGGRTATRAMAAVRGDTLL